jgi:hypothetical protein
MVLEFNRVIFPPDVSYKVAEAWAQWMKDNPPDPSIQKNLIVGVTSTEEGNVLAIGISEVVKGKAKEVLENTTAQNLFMAGKVPGLKYKTEIILNVSEAYKLLGMTAPDIS